MRSVTAAASERSVMIFTTIIAQKGIILSERDFLHFGQVAECFPPLRGRRTIARQDRSRAESWTPEMEEAARQKAIERNRHNG